jgi:ATP-dependent helicase/nuclease subunit A
MAGLSIVSASAGSGKTHKITQEYMNLLFHDADNYRHILAVTFTNKATEEMKSRIIRELYNLSSDIFSGHLNEIIAQTGLSRKLIKSKSNHILKKILHNYSRFSVSTIDSFFQKIIRAFTREIGIQSSFTIELDTDSILDKAIDQLFFEIESNDILKNWLILFAEDKIQEGRSWNFKKEIIELGKEVFKEKFRLISYNVSERPGNKKLLSEYRAELYKIINYFERNLSEKGERGLELINNNSLTIDDFSRGKSGPAGCFLKLAEKNYAEPGKLAKEATDNPEKWYKKASPVKTRIEEAYNSGLKEILSDIIDFFNDHYSDYKTSKTILANIFTLGILTDITGAIDRYIRDKNLFLIAYAPAFLNKIIGNNDTPFIYEKTGNYFHHFMIDEFQDTSGFQWNNFRPLIANSLAQNYDNLIVGDVKQSIYRWRDTDWEILSEKIHNEFSRESINDHTLSENRRSRKEIIEFNNSFFTGAAKLMQDTFNNELAEIENHSDFEKLKTNIVSVYSDVRQSQAEPDSNKGYVKIKFLDARDKDVTGENLIQILKELQDKGYKLKDIAILTRRRIEGKEIADFLIEYRDKNKTDRKYKFDVISDESLYLSNSSAVNFLIALLKYFINPGDSINNYFIVFEYLNYLKSDSGNGIIEIPEYDKKLRIDPGEFLPEDLVKSMDQIKNLNIYETVERLIQIFSLSAIRGELPYIQALQDLILEYSRNNLSNINTFLEYWEETGKKQSVSISEAQDAIRILTIHKSKGLEFKAVILPYCNWSFHNNWEKRIIWCKPSKSPFNSLNVVPVNYSQDLKNTLFASDYYTEKLKIFIDNLNLLYVAFTRAMNALYCLTDAFQNKEKGVKGVSGVLYKICSSESGNNITGNSMNEKLSFRSFYNKEKNTFEYGTLSPPKSGEKRDEPATTMINEYPALDSRKKLKIAYQSSEFFGDDADIMTKPLSYGKVMHEIFADIISIDDVENAIEKVFIEGKIKRREKESIYREIARIFEDPRILSWFSNNRKVITEKDIILPDGSLRRPDRVLIKDDSVIVIDYKFGMIESSEYITQIREYSHYLNEMGYNKIESYIWYINKGKIVKV